PKQVAAVQDFINKTQKFRYRLLVQRVSIDVIGPETAPNPEPTPVEEPQEVVPEKAEPASVAPAPAVAPPPAAPAVPG
ncbi:MAG: DUF389 domain-containing protein, partial [Vulcanococcus sp.]